MEPFRDSAPVRQPRFHRHYFLPRQRKKRLVAFVLRFGDRLRTLYGQGQSRRTVSEHHFRNFLFGRGLSVEILRRNADLSLFNDPHSYRLHRVVDQKPPRPLIRRG